MNVIGSGFMHRRYFGRMLRYVQNIFNQPLQLQPAAVCDMGCGDGTLLTMVYAWRGVAQRKLQEVAALPSTPWYGSVQMPARLLVPRPRLFVPKHMLERTAHAPLEREKSSHQPHFGCKYR